MTATASALSTGASTATSAGGGCSLQSDVVIRVITAIFLSQTLEAANNDVEVIIQERMRKKSMFVEQLEGGTRFTALVHFGSS